MVRAFLSLFTTEVRGMHEAAYLLAAFAFLSQVLALLRDRLFAGAFGAGETLDIYFAAFRVPDLLFATAASLLSLYALLPVLSRLEAERSGFGIAFLRRALLLFFVGMAVIAGALYLVVPSIIPLIAPGLSPQAQAQLELLTRILLLQPIFLGASNIVAALTQLRHRFFLYAVSPLLYNLGIIGGLLLLYPQWGIAGLGWGVVAGALLHLLMQVPFFLRERSEAALPAAVVRTSMQEVLWLSIPRTLTLAAGQLALFVMIALASLVAPGSIAVFMFAWNLQAVPLAIIGVSYSVAAFPTLAHLFAKGSNREFLAHIEAALRHIVFWAVPATVLIIVLRAQIVRTILGTGAFDWDATRLTAASLALFILSLVAQSIVLLIARAYYAAGKTAAPLMLGALFLATASGSAVLFWKLFTLDPFIQRFFEALLRVPEIAGTPVLALALGFALGALVQAGAGLWLLSRDFGISLVSLNRLAFQSFGAATIGGAAAYATLWFAGNLLDINTLAGIFAQGFAGGVVGLAVVAATLAALRNPEFFETIEMLRRRFRDSEPVALEPTDLS